MGCGADAFTGHWPWRHAVVGEEETTDEAQGLYGTGELGRLDGFRHVWRGPGVTPAGPAGGGPVRRNATSPWGELARPVRRLRTNAAEPVTHRPRIAPYSTAPVSPSLPGVTEVTGGFGPSFWVGSYQTPPLPSSPGAPTATSG